ncbi:MAG: magnesium and cobalt transport protein CorA [Candidatus Omnitrophica bacterium CG11_big_fil_rev_8_21_14_0_20_41_12]|nr:MAG: magnesium and cobalt transport protein CorA [Candidatus Omnitrophica bacterium CG11_big_fil_rev_8_21_14_0_20_41_12]
MFESFQYHPEIGLKTDLTLEEIKQSLKDEKSLIWIDLFDIDDSDIDFLTTTFSLHPLTIEDFILPNARPKIENFSDYLYLIMFSLEAPSRNEAKLITHELDFCLGRNFLITYHSSAIGPIVACKEKVKKQSPIIKNGPDMLLYSILDFCIDSYFPVIQEFDSYVDDMSDELFRDPSRETLRKIYNLKNSVMYLRRTIGPQADVINLVTRGDFPFILPANHIYFRNIYDNLLRLNDLVGTCRDIITGAMEAYVSVVSNRLNEVMKTLTVIATIMMPLTLIASIYGMNFRHMPELESKFGYPLVIVLMVVITVSMLAYFKRRKWL